MKKFLAVLLLMLGMTNFCWAQENAQTGENAKMHEFMLLLKQKRTLSAKTADRLALLLLKTEL